MGAKDKSSKGVPMSKLSDETKMALEAAAVFPPSKQRKAVAGLIQAPFTGDYPTHSGEIVGIF